MWVNLHQKKFYEIKSRYDLSNRLELLKLILQLLIEADIFATGLVFLRQVKLFEADLLFFT